VPLHTGGGIAFGSAGGEEQHTLTLAQLALHTHTVVADATPAPAADGNLPGLTRRLAGSTGGNLYGPPNNLVPMNAAAISSVGAGLGHVNLQPFLAINFIIALQGRFPVRRRAFIRNIMYIVRGLFGNRG
jgi:microcystin-dependent protein